MPTNNGKATKPPFTSNDNSTHLQLIIPPLDTAGADFVEEKGHGPKQILVQDDFAGFPRDSSVGLRLFLAQTEPIVGGGAVTPLAGLTPFVDGLDLINANEKHVFILPRRAQFVRPLESE